MKASVRVLVEANRSRAHAHRATSWTLAHCNALRNTA
jgi:hypothetical protein